MRKQKYVVLAVLTVLCLGGASGAVFYVQKHTQPVQKNGVSNSSLADASGATGSTSTTSSGDASLGVASPASTSSMGQLGQNQSNNQNGASTSQSGVASSGDSGSSGSATTSANESALEKLLDPTTFSQYNAPKYLNATSTYYVDLQVGTGATIAAGQTVSVYYKGWLTNGQLFDETKDNSSGQMQPFQFTYGANPSQVIAGWEQGLSGMKVGGVRFLIIPPAEGYGSAGQGSIPGNSVLLFQVQLAAAQ